MLAANVAFIGSKLKLEKMENKEVEIAQHK